jgi:hypothetical protein
MGGNFAFRLMREFPHRAKPRRPAGHGVCGDQGGRLRSRRHSVRAGSRSGGGKVVWGDDHGRSDAAPVGGIGGTNSADDGVLARRGRRGRTAEPDGDRVGTVAGGVAGPGRRTAGCSATTDSLKDRQRHGTPRRDAGGVGVDVQGDPTVDARVSRGCLDAPGFVGGAGCAGNGCPDCGV